MYMIKLFFKYAFFRKLKILLYNYLICCLKITQKYALIEKILKKRKDIILFWSYNY